MMTDMKVIDSVVGYQEGLIRIDGHMTNLLRVVASRSNNRSSDGLKNLQ